MAFYVFWDTLYSAQQDKHKEVEDWLYRHCELRGFHNVVFVEMHCTGWHGESKLAQSGRHVTTNLFREDWSKITTAHVYYLLEAIASSLHYCPHHFHLHCPHLTTYTQAIANATRYNKHPLSPILHRQFIVQFFNLIGSAYINSDFFRPPCHGPRCITIPTTAASVKAGRLVLTTEGSEVKKWQQWMQESQQMQTMPGPMKRAAEMLEWDIEENSGGSILYLKNPWGLSTGPLPFNKIPEKTMESHCQNAWILYLRNPWGLRTGPLLFTKIPEKTMESQ
ncbi:hypothetical protein V8E53_015921 [Lactarius tabidus]